MTYVGDGQKRTQKKEKGFDFVSKKTANYSSGFLRESLELGLFSPLGFCWGYILSQVERPQKDIIHNIHTTIILLLSSHFILFTRKTTSF